MMIFGLIFILSVFAILVVNTGIAPYRWLKAGSVRLNALAYGLSYGIAAVIIIAVFIMSKFPDTFLPSFLIKFAYCGLGTLIYAIITVNIADIVLLLLRLVKINPTKAVAITVTAVCLALTVVTSAYGIINARTIKTASYQISAGEKTAYGFKIALISDLHIGHITDGKLLEKIAAEVNKSQPDVICIAGDVFDGDMTAVKDPDAVKAALRSLNAPHGVYACLGNHDAGSSYEQITDFLSDTGIHLLQDEYVTVADSIILAGRRDSSPIRSHGDKRADKLSLPTDSELPIVVLDHQPTNITQYDGSVDLILCGHTHNGQIFPGNLLVSLMYDAPYGYYRASENSPQVIVTSGAGTWGPPLRVGTDSEIAVITIE